MKQVKKIKGLILQSSKLQPGFLTYLVLLMPFAVEKNRLILD